MPMAAYSGVVRALLFWTGAFDRDSEMTTSSELVNSPQDATPESLLALLKYLDLALDKGKSVVMMRHEAGVCSVYVGDPADEENPLARQGTIAAGVADEILELTRAGVNRLEVGDQVYRFVRSFTHVAGVGAVVFGPA
jgi:hypothetical protein